RGNTTKYQLDEKGRPIIVTYPEGNQDRKVYDDEDKLIETSTYRIDLLNPNGASSLLQKKTFEYDALHRLSKETTFMSDHDPGATYDSVETTYEYDLDSLVIGVTDAENRKTVTTYDQVHRRQKVTDPLGNAVEYEYDENDNVTQEK